jgi:16S rRNA (guanine(1405)-N(7))-methyltransferase
MNEKLKKIVVEDVRQKKELSFLSEDFIIDNLENILRIDKKKRLVLYEKINDNLDISFIRDLKVYKNIVKEIRDSARKIYGIFNIPSKIKFREDNITKICLNDTKIIDEILNSHLSTKERMQFYDYFFKIIFEETKEPKKILDIACGLNPLAFFRFSNLKDVNYICNEMSEIDAQHLNKFFKNNKINGKCYPFNFVKELKNNINLINDKYDVCFLLKALDTFETQKKYITYDILDNINASFIIASFPFQSINQKNMSRGFKISWFEKMLLRKEFSYKTINFPNEIVYILEKN